MKRLTLLASAVVLMIGLFAAPTPALAHGTCTTTAIFVYVQGDTGTEGAPKGKIECSLNHPEMHLLIDFDRRTGPSDPWTTIDEQPYECDNTNACVDFVLPSHPLCIGHQYRAHVEGWVWSPADGRHHDDTDNAGPVDGGHHC